MKHEALQPNRLDEQVIKEAAEAAVRDLQLDAEVKSVSADGEQWRIQFTADYGEFCDALRNSYGKENSLNLIREKVKRHILKQQQNKIRSGVRIRRGKQERRAPSGNLVASAAETIAEVVNQTAAVTASILSQAAHLPKQALAAIADAAETATTAKPSRTSKRKIEQPLARVTVKTAAGKSSRQSSSTARQATAKKSPTTKKAGSKSKPSAVKATAKIGQKKGRAKKR